MNIELVTLDNGTTIGYGIDDQGNPDYSTIEVETDHEYVAIRPKVTKLEIDPQTHPNTVGFAVTLQIDKLDELRPEDAEGQI